MTAYDEIVAAAGAFDGRFGVWDLLARQALDRAAADSGQDSLENQLAQSAVEVAWLLDLE